MARIIDDKKLKELKKSGKKLTGVGIQASIPGASKHRRKKLPKPAPVVPDEKAKAVTSLAQSLESAVKGSQEIIKITHKMVDSVLVKLKQIRTDPVDVKVDVKSPEPVKNKKKTIKCENIERDSKDLIKSFELREM